MMTPPEQPRINLAFLFEFTEGDNVQMIYLIQKFLDNYPKEVSNIDKALMDGNLDGLYQAAHSFRPQLEFVGLQNTASLLLSIERGARDGTAIDQLGQQFEEVRVILNQLPKAEDWI